VTARWAGTDLERLTSKITPEPTTGCWLWTAALDSAGYGTLNVNGKTVKAHRWAWSIFHGPIPAGRFVCHRCDNPACVNAETHLFLGTVADNSADMVRKGRGCLGARNGRAVLTPDRVAEIRRLARSGRLRMRGQPGEITQTDLARAYGVTQSQISAVANGREWRLE
jgi:hypothetical protein